jgi:hypothetical protein
MESAKSGYLDQRREKIILQNIIPLMQKLSDYRFIGWGMLCLILFSYSCKSDQTIQDPVIDVWYGEKQVFGVPGHTQKWVNILGNATATNGIKSLSYTLNSSKPVQLSWGRNDTRLANTGDFNIEIDRKTLREGANTLMISLVDSLDKSAKQKVIVENITDNIWPLPYSVEWSKVENIQDVVQIVDGKWELTPEGLKTVEPYYDRVIALGDSTWRNYEIKTSVVFHDYAQPLRKPPTYGVTHAALASRWPGHDADNNQPHIKWWPLGATCEFQLRANLDSCRWRILGNNKIRAENKDQFKKIELGKKYMMKSQVQTLESGETRYRVKFWDENESEPADWQLENREGQDDLQYGSALLLAHNSNVTFGDIHIRAIE